MRRRVKADLIEPPGRLLVYDPAEWLPLVDPTGYDVDRWRNIRNGVPDGEPHLSAEGWRQTEARTMWMHTRLDWCQRFGWPGGLTVLDLLRMAVADRRRAFALQVERLP